MMPTTCVVALPIPVLKPYSYAIPTSLADRVVPGTRVLVPVRARELFGVVLEVGEGSVEGLRAVLLAPDSEPLLPQSLLDLATWISNYYTTPIGLTVRAMLPPALWGSSRLVAQVLESHAVSGGTSRDVLNLLHRAGGRLAAASLARKLKRPVWDTLQRLARNGNVVLETEPATPGPVPSSETVILLTRSIPSILERDSLFGRAARQRSAYEAIDALGGEALVNHLRTQLGFSTALLKGLVEKGVARLEIREKLRDPFSGIIGVPPPSPNQAQQAASRAIREMPAGEAALLWGVTGSGKTLVYLESFREEVERGSGAIVLVPEISLTPQAISRVIGVFGDTVAVLHSGLSDAERADAWRAVVSGQRRVVVGARSAVFAPVRDLAAIIVDEEHDASYKHGESPRYHARDVALKRASIEGARVVLGSATPSLETWSARNRIVTVSLPQRVEARPLPQVTLVDMRSEPRVSESGPVPWSKMLDEAMSHVLDKNQQAILLLNRRGFAHFLQCAACGAVAGCPHCSISLTVHRTPARLRCHYCDHDEPVPAACRECGASTTKERGTGTQLLERWLAERYPEARLARMDADTTTARWSHSRILEAVESRNVDILFGTQMVAKGLDFPGVTLVGVVDADTSLHLPDFRSPERTFQLIAQVAGRAGRGPDGGRVLVQTRTPQHYALQTAAKHDFEAFAEHESEIRKAPPYPPHVGLVNVVVSGLEEPQVANAAAEIADWLRGLVAKRTDGAIDVLGPAPAPLARIKRRWRWHVLYRGEDKVIFDRVTRYAARRAPHTDSAHLRVVFDRDPVSVL
jgi:primosomal protein N' (replication factor Y)